MKILAWRSLPLVAVALALPLFSQSAKATDVLFACSNGLGTPNCNGSATTILAGDGVTVTASSSPLGITVGNTQGPNPAAPPSEVDQGSNFLLTWSYTNPGGGTATLVEQGLTQDGSTISGQIVSGTYNSTDQRTTLGVIFDVLPPDFQSFLGSPTGTGGITYIEVATPGFGPVTNATVDIKQTPEPASYLLMGTGMLLCAFFLRRSWGASAAGITAA